MQSSGCGLVDRVLVYHVCRLRVHPQQNMNHVWWCILKKIQKNIGKGHFYFTFLVPSHTDTCSNVCVHPCIAQNFSIYFMCNFHTFTYMQMPLQTHCWLCIVPLSVYTPLILMHRQTKYTDILGRGLYEKRGMGK